MGFMDKFRASRANHFLQQGLRVTQFLSSVISLGLFASRIRAILRLVHRASTSNGAVAGLLSAAVLYSLITMITSLALKRAAPRIMRWTLVVFDLIFMCAFIVVAVLTRPNGGSSGPCKARNYRGVEYRIPTGQNCNLPWGVFILAIVSTILHLLTALFHEARDKYKEHKMQQSLGQDGEMVQDRH
ncbi:hypothetical protein LTR37_010768 [Vermiconidia calcicola]|uniref:Uncharacterized protein n=1 Tax=Vermiconidia calcicola TaxID=1690605 RepID=A0ACC3N731_9PEZI|nr:hypothetical protein LTR37_010768 [Vermiconidia calcicola]